MGMVHPLKRPSSLVDPIHGLVRLTREELGVVDTPTFQRLRRVKQNGLLHLVFPAATHTRFEHSIGVLASVDAMLQALVLNSEAASKKLKDVGSAEPSDGINFSTVEPKTLQAIFRVARLAALVHDLGHGPFSHAFDSFAPHHHRIRKMLSNDDALNPLAPYVDQILDPGKDKEPVHHEVMSVLLFAWVWREKNDSDVLLAVCASILGGEFLEVIRPAHPLASWLPLLHDLIASAPADADRMDYVERDSRSCGVTYGIYDRERLLKSLLCYRGEDRGGSAVYRLGWKRSGLRALENFLQARFQLFVQIYYHKTNHALSLMLQEIGELAKSLGSEIFEQTTLSELVDAYAKLGDELFLRQLRGLDPEFSKWNEEICAIANAIENRHFWHRIYETHDDLPARFVKNVLQNRKHRKYRKYRKYLRLDVQKLKATKDLDKGGALLDRGKGGHYRMRRTVTWTGASAVLKTLQEQEKAITRIYLCRTVVNGDDAAAIEEATKLLQEQARALSDSREPTKS